MNGSNAMCLQCNAFYISPLANGVGALHITISLIKIKKTFPILFDKKNKKKYQKKTSK